MYHSRSASHYSYHKKGTFFPFLIVRLILSLILFSIFGFGIYRAMVYFSGFDPLNLDPQKLIVELASSDVSAQTASKLFNFDPKKLIKGQLRSSQTSTDTQESTDSSKDESAGNNQSPKTKLLTFAVVADSHNKNSLLAKALAQAKQAGAKFVIGTGDYTEVGTTEEFEAAKTTFVKSGLPYYLTAGDHDLWNSRDKGYEADYFFKKSLGSTYQSFGDSNIRFIILYNSDNYFGVDDYEMNWFDKELQRVKMDKPLQTFVFVHEPLYHPSSDHIMGKTNQKVAEQAQTLIDKIKDAPVGEVFSGDVHYYSRYTEPQSGVKMTVAGAVTDDRNVQNPRFLLVDVYTDGSYNISDTEIK